jgi:hypothetical protein
MPGYLPLCAALGVAWIARVEADGALEQHLYLYAIHSESFGKALFEARMAVFVARLARPRASAKRARSRTYHLRL